MERKVFEELRATFRTGKTKSKEWREGQLKALMTGLKEMADEIAQAISNDLGRSPVEAIQEVLNCSGEAQLILLKLSQWMEPEIVPNPPTMPVGKSIIYSRPKGVVLVISPFNFPVVLAICPLMGAIAAGNCCLLKPSEISANTAVVLQKLCDKYLDRNAIRVVQGAVEETTALLALPFDHFMYTGNGRVGKIVMKAAAEHLAECTLELGGKSPVYVHEDADVENTAKRILAGKFLNDGQVCIAPDYLLVHEKIRDQLVMKMQEFLPKFYGQNKDGMARLVNTHHFDRVKRLLEEKHGGKVVEGGLERAVRDKKYIPPTFVLDPSMTSMLMTEEIFGPVLPIHKVKGLDQALDIIHARDNPLAAYVFSNTPEIASRFLSEVQSGGGCVNDVIAHLRNKRLPLGGSGKSGIGRYTGKFSFDLFSNKQGIVEMPLDKEEGRMYPPFNQKLYGMLKSTL